MSTPGFSGSSYDRSVENSSSNMSTLHKMKETYWITKQAVIQKLGKKEDSHVVASDSQLDSKLEVFKAIQESTMTLLDVLEKYQIRLCAAAQEENAMGRYLKSHCSNNKTRAAKIMAAVGKSQSTSAQERLSLRGPLVRLYQEVETFRYRAISDTLINVHRMEGARTQYRGALLWMKKVSEDLDPDTYKQLEKFRKVQTQVRKSKQRFDKLKLDVMQKVDLLAASRCNMFSHVLAQYQAALLAFWKNTAHTMAHVAHNFKGYQYYEFNILRELTDTTRKLAEETSRDTKREESDLEEGSDDEELIDINDDPLDIGSDDSAAALRKVKDARGSPKLPDGPLCQEDGGRREMKAQTQKGHEDLMALTEGGRKGEEFTPFMSFEDDDVNLAELSAELGKESVAKPQPPKTLGELGIHQNTTTTSGQGQDPEDDLSLLNLILNAPSEGEDEFAQEWQGLFGEDPVPVTPHTVPAERDPSQQLQQQRHTQFMPSSLMDLGAMHQPFSASGSASSSAAFSLLGEEGSGAGMVKGPVVESSSLKPPSSTDVKSSSKPAVGPLPAHQEQKKDMSAWISLFADLDPLSNPDAVGRRHTDDGSGNL